MKDNHTSQIFCVCVYVCVCVTSWNKTQLFQKPQWLIKSIWLPKVTEIIQVMTSGNNALDYFPSVREILN